MIAITGATGHLGRHVIGQLLEKVPANQIIAAVRSPDKAKDYADRGVQVRLTTMTRRRWKQPFKAWRDYC